MEEIKECSRCRNKFKISALKNGLCGVCADLPPNPEGDEGRIVSSKTVRETDVVTIVRDIVKETVPTRDQIEVMIRVIVKEELAAMNSIVGNSGPTSVVATGSDETLIVVGKEKIHKVKVFKPKNCIKCGNSFIPRVGFQKICDNCRKETK